MAHFLKGRYKIYHKCGIYECVKDTIRFRQYKDTQITMELTRRDMESMARRFLRSEYYSINLIPVDYQQPALGGKALIQAL